MQEPTTRDLMNAILELHSAVSLGFARVDERFAGVDERFAGVDERFARMEQRLTGVEGEVRGLQRWMATSDQRFNALEGRIH